MFQKFKTMNMKKLAMIFGLMVLISSNGFAQSKIGYKMGLNLNHVSTNDADLKEELSPRPSIHFGLMGDFSLGKQFAFQPQLLFSGRGAKVAHDGHSDVFAFNSIELPLNFVFKSNGTSGFFGGAGPVLGYNLSGKIKEEDASEEIEFGNTTGKITRADLGGNLLIGYQLNKGLFFTANYTTGFSNWSNNANSTWRNNNLAVSIGYFFNR